MIELTLMIVLLSIYIFDYIFAAYMMIDKESNTSTKIVELIFILPTCVVTTPALLAYCLAKKLNKL